MVEMMLASVILVIEMMGASLIVISVILCAIEIGRSAIRLRLSVAATTARLDLAQRLVLALEFLIAADILKTIVTPTLEGMALLGSIIAIRTVLSLSIAYELRREHPVQPLGTVDTKNQHSPDHYNEP